MTDEAINIEPNEEKAYVLAYKPIERFKDYYHLAEQFAQQQPIHYDDDKKWWLWNKEENRWQLTNETAILTTLQKNVIGGSFTVKGKPKNELLESLRRIGWSNKLEKPNPYWVQFKDEIINVMTGETIKASPKYFLANPIPWKLGQSEETPTLDKLFTQWVTKNGVQDELWTVTLYEIMAYAMLSTQPLQKLFALTGAGANGKGTFLRILQKFLGSENCASSEIKVLTTRNFETSNIYKKLAVFMSECDEGDLKNTTLLKQLTGEDLIRYEFKGHNIFSEYSYATLIMATNSLPTTPDKSIGFYRRWVIVDFPNQFTVCRDIISEIPDEEYENLALKLVGIARRILFDGKFTNEGTIEEKTKRFEQRSNPLGHYIETCMDATDPDGHVRLKDFHDNLQEWLIQNNHRKMTIIRTGRLLRDLGYSIEKQRDEKESGGYTTHNVIFGLKWSIMQKTL